MSLLIGTTAGAYRLDGTTDQIVEGTRINHMAKDVDSWWVADGKGRIHKDGAVAATMPAGTAPLCIQPTPDTVWVGTSGARLYALDDDELSEDEFFGKAPNRDTWYTPWGAPADIRSMTLDADHTLYINVHVGGILRYDNTGVVPTLDISADVHQVAAHPTQKGAVFAACAYGLAASHNGHDFEIRSTGLHADYCRAVAVLEEKVIVSASTGPRTTKGRLYRGELWDGGFEPLTNGLPEWFDDNLNTHCLVAVEDGLFAGQGGTVWHSDDLGETWTEAVGGLPKVTCLA